VSVGTDIILGAVGPDNWCKCGHHRQLHHELHEEPRWYGTGPCTITHYIGPILHVCDCRGFRTEPRKERRATVWTPQQPFPQELIDELDACANEEDG
jgi:hypothetical protein